MNKDAIPQELKDNERWLLWDSSAETPRRPHWRGDFQGVSWNNADDWHSFEEAYEAAKECDTWGVGYVFTPELDYYALDIDGPYNEDGQPRDWFPGIDVFQNETYGEWSPGGGLHFIVRGEPPEWWRDCEVDPNLHQGVDALTNKFCTITSDVVDGCDVAINTVEADSWFTEAYHRIRGRLPNTNNGEHSDSEPSDELSKEQVEEALSYVDADLPHNEWVRMAYAVHAWDNGSTGKSVFEQWSRQGSKWDEDAQRSINSIWQHANAASGVTVGTLIHEAKENGWEPPWEKYTTNGGETPDIDRSDGLDWEAVTTMLSSNENGSTTKAFSWACELMNETYDIVAVRETGAVYFYDGKKGIYVRKGETYIEEKLNEHLGDHVNVNRIRNIREQLIATNYVASDGFTPPREKVCLKNGVLDLETRDLEDHTPEYYFTSRLEVEYDENAEAERWPEFLQNSVGDRRDVKKIEEFIGYCLEAWGHEREKNLFVVGPSQSGKSTFVDSVEALFNARPAVTNLTPQQIADTRFDAAALKEALLNAVNDINAAKIEDTGTLKRVFSGESTKMERKHRDAEFGKPRAKHLFSANWTPRLVGEDEAFYRRVLIVEFPNQVPDSERDTELADTLQEEAAGILIRALDARDRLNDQDHFTNDRDRSDTRKVWDSWRDAHKRFLYTQFEITGDDSDSVMKDAYYRAYKEFAAREGFDIKAKQGVTKSLQWVPEVAVPKESDEYLGLRWREDEAGASEPAAASQASLQQPQQKRVNWVREIVKEFETPTDPAKESEVVEYAEGQGREPEKVRNVIENLKKDGTFQQINGGLRVT